jgi:hypothetical protein
MGSAGQVNNQWMIGRTPLGGENLGYCFRIGCIGPQAVDRLGRESNQFAGLQEFDRPGQFLSPESSGSVLDNTFSV